MKVFVVGKLGEVIKKVCELKRLIEEAPNAILLAEYTAYQQILDSWPIAENTNCKLLCASFRMLLDNLRAREAELRGFHLSVGAYSAAEHIILSEYLCALDKVRNALEELNALGKYIGPSPWMELEEA